MLARAPKFEIIRFQENIFLLLPDEKVGIWEQTCSFAEAHKVEHVQITHIAPGPAYLLSRSNRPHPRTYLLSPG